MGLVLELHDNETDVSKLARIAAFLEKTRLDMEKASEDFDTSMRFEARGKLRKAADHLSKAVGLLYVDDMEP